MAPKVSESDLPAEARNFRYLVDTFGPRLGIPAGTNKIAQYFQHKSRISPATIRRLWTGEGSTQPHSRTLEKLADFFKDAVPGIQGHWLLAADLDQFVKLLNQIDNQDIIPITVPGYRKNVASLKTWLCGTYVAYRYPFEARSDEMVIRQVLHIWPENDSVLRFRMSFWSRSDEPGQQAMEFQGHVLPVGLSLFFVGLNTGQTQVDRGCSLFFHDDRTPMMRDCKLGLLSSTRLHGDWGPCAASTILVRVDWSPPDLNKFINDVTYIGPTEQIIRGDFGAKHEDWLKSFIDNRPRGTQEERALLRVEGGRSYRDPVLRLDRFRFNEIMPNILEDVRDDPEILAPFKKNWALRGMEPKR
jgi:hypothetical protein